jgi:tellurite resistance protein
MKNQEITYDMIKPLIAEEAMEGSNMFCKFKVEGDVFEANHSIRMDTSDTSNKIKGMVKLQMVSRGRSFLMRTLRSIVGGGMLGSTASMVGNEVVRSQTTGANFSVSDKQDAVVNAFKRIMFNFYFDEDSKSWKIARRLSEFARRLKQKPIAMGYDKKTLARLLLELAKADGEFNKEEKEFLQDFIDEDTGTFPELLRSPSLSRVELEEINREVKENIFMVASAVTFIDKSFDEREKAKLYEVAEMMMISDTIRNELIKHAQDYTIESIILSQGMMSRDELYQLADKIGMDRSEAERAQVRFEKRQD